MTSLQHKTRGAALIVAILVLAILLVIVLAFFQASRQEMHIATNYRNATQADLLAEGGTAIAIAFLNHDRAIHPTVTSVDHAWKTYFNGSWAVGKQWTWTGGAPLTREPNGYGVPQVNLDNWPVGQPLPQDNLYIPRLEGTIPVPDPDNYSPAGNPFALAYLPDTSPLSDATVMFGNPSAHPVLATPNLVPQQVDTFADWDNDEDGYRDSAWIPMPMDVFPDGPDLGDGLDNDLDGLIDEGIKNGLDDDGNGIADDEPIKQLPAERALFLYWGGNDGLDNNGDGQIDELAEQKPFLTTPFVPVFLEENGVVIVDIATYPSFNVQAFNPNTGAIEPFPIDPNRGSADVDVLDNDYNLVVNESDGRAYRLIDAADPAYTPEQRERENRLRQASGYHLIDPSYLPSLPANTFVTFSGEPVCELVGRVAVLVKDENSKVNMNAAGGRNFRDLESPYVVPQGGHTTGELRRALWSGASTAEYETRVLPQLGLALSDRLWNLRTGAHAGIGIHSIFRNADPYEPRIGDTAATTYGLAALNLDVSLPGFGRVDDNGNALWMAMDGIDNDGDGSIDEGLADLPLFNTTTGVFDPPNGVMDTAEAWTFEGIDEPQEYQSYRPHRNKALFPVAGHPTAEEDTIDNSTAVATDDHPADGAVNEIGELGDRYLRSTEQLKLVQEMVHVDPTFTANRFEPNRNLVTVNGTDLNSRFQRYDSTGNALNIPKLSGPKLDYNYATTEQIFNAIQRDWGYFATPLPAPTVSGDVRAFSSGLRREDTAIYSDGILAGGAAGGSANYTRPSDGALMPAFPPDLELKAAQLAASIRDARDTNHSRTTVTTTIEDDWSAGRIQNSPRFISYTQAGMENIRINEIMARPVRRVEAEMGVEAAFNPNAFSGNLSDLDFQVEVQQLDATETPVAVDDTTAPWVRHGTVIGDRAGVTTTTVNVDPADAASENTVIQYRFRPSPGLPPGRYYLLLNSMLRDTVTGRLEPTIFGDPSDPTDITVSPNIEYTFKYATLAEQDILTDITGGTSDGLPIPWNDSARVGYRNMAAPTPGMETGMVFLPSDATYSATASVGYGENEAYTVEMPPFDAANQEYLYVAIRYTEALDPANPLLSINYFEFSQEPDHEWIEVVNTATGGDSINLGGWQLEVGTNGARRDDNTFADSALFTVPTDTVITPGGSLLLGFDKYDDGGRAFTGTGMIQTNGISLTRVLDAATSIYMSEPPIPGWLLGVTQDSVFARNAADPDFIDWNGDNLLDPDDNPDWNTPTLNTPPRYTFDFDNDGIVDLATDVADRGVLSTPDIELGITTPDKAFDRIVELTVDRPAALNSIDTVAKLSEIVLNGGLLPNNPEHDGIDNDGDNGILSTDRIDNDGDGFVDEADSTADPFDLRMEGIDEGRWEELLDTLGNPIGQRGNRPPGSYSETSLYYTYANTSGTVIPFAAPYLGAGTDVVLPALADPPEWKAFVERRWYTPDNVPVTLYEGTAADERIADRTTYSERDVINRATDDILSVDIDADGTVDRDPLNANCLSFWPDNTMGVDFYRAIERKHPLYNGDLHGLSNRWQATDGAYDDWSPSTAIFESASAGGFTRRLYDTTGALQPGWDLYWHAFSGSPLRMSLSQRMMENPSNQFLANDATLRRWAYDKAREGFRNRTYASPGDLVSLTSFMDRRDPAPQPPPATVGFAFDDVPVNYEQVGAAPHMDTTVQGVLLAQHPYDNLYGRDDMAAVTASTAMDPLVLAAGTANFYTITPQPGGWNAGGWDGTIAGAAPEPWTPVFLFPLIDSGGANIDLTPYSPPLPADTFALDANRLASYSMGNPLINYLFTGPYGGVITNTAAFDPAALPAGDLLARWPLKLRTVMYASQNIVGFDETGPRDDALNPAATALFEWDGADGLENGDYDVYIVTADDLTPVAAAEFASRTDPADSNTGRYLTIFGRNLLLSTSGTDTDDMVFDVEMFTDRSYTGGSLEPLGPNGRCWIDGFAGSPVDGYPQANELERSVHPTTAPAPMNTLNPQGDSFGMLPSRTPDENGVMYYGSVRVENNYLALLLRNWTENGELARFSRVILTPRPRTTGRLNINTVESALADFGSPSGINPFNPLVGTPGMLATYAPATAQRFGYFNEGDIGPADTEYGNALGLSDLVVRHREHFDSELGVLPIRVRPDGRYYENPSDMVSQHPSELPSGDNMNSYPNWFNVPRVPAPDAYQAYEEMMGRYSRLANLVTTRSDVFEITVTAQTGYLSSEDLNGDGRIDYRNDFIVTGEKKIRTVYER